MNRRQFLTASLVAGVSSNVVRSGIAVARLGNFGVTVVSPDETWVTVAEWMQPKGVEKYGSDGSVYVVRIRWAQPNRNV